MGFVDVRVGWGLQLGGGGACNCERVCLQLRGDEYLWPHRCVYVLSRAYSLSLLLWKRCLRLHCPHALLRQVNNRPLPRVTPSLTAYHSPHGGLLRTEHVCLFVIGSHDMEWQEGWLGWWYYEILIVISPFLLMRFIAGLFYISLSIPPPLSSLLLCACGVCMLVGTSQGHLPHVSAGVRGCLQQDSTGATRTLVVGYNSCCPVWRNVYHTLQYLLYKKAILSIVHDFLHFML